MPRNKPTKTAGARLKEVKPIAAAAATAATAIIVSAYCPIVIERPVRASRAARISRRGSQRRATRSILGVALWSRASDRVAAAAGAPPPSARSYTDLSRRW